ncbi:MULTISPECIES: DUF2537 domain-containing protein [Prauserella salsuginis group]|uniref:DUF2537 domain-containing protein n=1 Tax=Prauserella salsuginis TaxID=387889 RepID=A0ABW6G7H8_9PSEU|nr:MULTISPECIES: DUF2537 domain-containing protein [Prauserella salsuginis group]MCR3720691.1 Protein of unknown function (DUF2537) [Prauserella flava]MCR3735228.1 Protein of unknown function (DUF2537) [Prauserella salsuginis]
MHGAELELDVDGDRAVLVGTGGRTADPAAFSLGGELTDALHEWARVSAVVGAGAGRAAGPGGTGAVDAREGEAVVAHRGRQLAGRVAAALGVSVSYRDPVAGRTFVAVPPAEEAGGEAEPPSPGAPGGRQVHGRFDALAEWWRVQAAQNPGPVPWGTGVLVGAFFAVVMIVAMLALAGALASATHGLVAIVAALVVSAGLAPSLWLGRRVPVVRWIVGGVAAGIALSWIGVLVIVL